MSDDSPPADRSPARRHLPATRRREPLFPNAALVARREYLDRLRSRAFLISTIVVAIVAAFVALIPLGLKYIDQHTITRVAVAAPTDALADDAVGLLDALLNQPPAGQDPDRWEKPYRVDRAIDQLAAVDDVRAGHLDGLLIVIPSAGGGYDFAYHSREVGATRQSQLVQFGALSLAILEWNNELRAAGPGASGPPGEAPTIAFHAPAFALQSELVGGSPGAPIDQQELAGRTILALLFVVLMVISLVIYGMWVATSVGAEKSSRVMELLISAATPMQLLTGKVLGVAAAGLTQYAAIVLPAALVLLLQDRIAGLILDPGAGPGAPILSLSPGLFGAYGLFFLLGLAFYSLLYASAGSLVTHQEDVQQLSLPLSLLTMAGYFLTITGLSSVGAPWFVALSYVPFFSPFLMLARIMIGRAEPLEVALSVALLVLAIVVAAIVAARVFSAGVLLYGQRPGVREFIAAARTRR